jgi:hypothetical protein
MLMKLTPERERSKSRAAEVVRICTLFTFFQSSSSNLFLLINFFKVQVLQMFKCKKLQSYWRSTIKFVTQEESAKRAIVLER